MILIKIWKNKMKSIASKINYRKIATSMNQKPSGLYDLRDNEPQRGPSSLVVFADKKNNTDDLLDLAEERIDKVTISDEARSAQPSETTLKDLLSAITKEIAVLKRDVKNLMDKVEV